MDENSRICFDKCLQCPRSSRGIHIKFYILKNLVQVSQTFSSIYFDETYCFCNNEVDFRRRRIFYGVKVIFSTNFAKKCQSSLGLFKKMFYIITLLVDSKQIWKQSFGRKNINGGKAFKTSKGPHQIFYINKMARILWDDRGRYIELPKIILQFAPKGN